MYLILLKKYVFDGFFTDNLAWLKNCGQRWINFFFEKEDFLKNGYGYDFETFTNGFLAKKLYQNQSSPED